MISLFILIAALALVIQSANFLIEGASSIAKRLHVSDLVIGLTIVAFGTSLPELIVGIIAGLEDSSGLTVGNVIGSNIANVLLILGTAALFRTLSVKLSTIWREIPFSLLASFVLIVMLSDNFFDGTGEATISRVEGITLICFFMIFLYYTFLAGRVSGERDEDVDVYSYPASAGYILVGTVGLLIGGQLSVTSSIDLATELGLSETLIGLTVVAIGTSLPELVTSVIATRRGNTDIAVGNIIGSNIFNIFWILGVSAIVAPITVSEDLSFDLGVLLIASLVMFVFTVEGKANSLNRREGIVLLAGFFLYMAYTVITAL